MKQLFASATIKLTAWYLLILMTISLLFSTIIYNLSLSEISTRLDVFESRMERSESQQLNLSELGARQLRESTANLLFALFYLNILILIVGGIGSYKLARRSLRPIEAAHDAQSRFTSDASHELRTPLAVMKSELEVALRDSRLSKQDMREQLTSNLEEVNRLSELAGMLLQLSQYEKPRLVTERLSLSTIITKAIHTPSLATDRIQLHIPKKSIYITVNEASITELCVLLIDNALRYSPAGSKVNIRLSEKRQSKQIVIENTGKGISPAQLPHVFERFYRGDSSRTGSEANYGLGLALAKRIADLHDATITIASEPDVTTSATISFSK